MDDIQATSSSQPVAPTEIEDTERDSIQATSPSQPVAPTDIEDTQKDSIQGPSSSEPAVPTQVEDTQKDSIQAPSSSEPLAPTQIEDTQVDDIQATSSARPVAPSSVPGGTAPSSSEPLARTQVEDTQKDSTQATSPSQPVAPTQVEGTRMDDIQATSSGPPAAPTQVEDTRMDDIQATSSGPPAASPSVAGGTARDGSPTDPSDDSSGGPAAPVRSAPKSAAASVARATGKKKATPGATLGPQVQSPASEDRSRSQTPSVDMDGSRLSQRGTPETMASVPKPKRSIVDLSANTQPAKRAKTDAAHGPSRNKVRPYLCFSWFSDSESMFQLCDLCGGNSATLMTCADRGCHVQVCVGHPSRECFTRIDDEPLAETEWYCQEHQQHKLINVRCLPHHCRKLLIRITVPMQQGAQPGHVHEIHAQTPGHYPHLRWRRKRRSNVH